MQYMKLNPGEREALLASLSGMPEFVARTFSGLSPKQTLTPGPDGGFCPVEQVWHLADLEREGFAVRIEKLLHEPEPHLPDFDGTRVASERNYRSLSLTAGLAAFAEARRRNVEVLRGIGADSWTRRGTQEGVGRVSLCDMPGFMAQHDADHRAEIDAWRQSRFW